MIFFSLSYFTSHYRFHYEKKRERNSEYKYMVRKVQTGMLKKCQGQVQRFNATRIVHSHRAHTLLISNDCAAFFLFGIQTLISYTHQKNYSNNNSHIDLIRAITNKNSFIYQAQKWNWQNIAREQPNKKKKNNTANNAFQCYGFVRCIVTIGEHEIGHWHFI